MRKQIERKRHIRSSSSSLLCANKGAWTAEEDQKLADFVRTHGAKKWKSIPVQAGLNRCGKSCRFRWLNYLRPNIKRGNISDQEEDLILRLHKLLGNRWSLIARRLPGRTDNEIKNYWNSHLSKKIMNQSDSTVESSSVEASANHIVEEPPQEVPIQENLFGGSLDIETSFNVDEFFDFSNDGLLSLEWVSEFLDHA
ncbi:hypothetical protein Scep_007113 [Stephania cephalantha]|uniref:Uncharacterized protein n=1 Tax=Stephania cephalantha TaxID=152367 RepID=A0AAP0K976_9MAGN